VSRLEKRLSAQVAQASHDFGMLEAGDHVMVCVSGGKDSLTLLHLLRHIQRRAPFPFTLVAVHLDQRQPGYPEGLLGRYFESAGYDYRVVREDTYTIVKDRIPEGKTYCSLCSRLRRGVLYNVAVELRATKIALGHHRNDVIETLLLNAFFAGQLKAMPPRLRSDDGRNVVIRPLVYCAEHEIAAFAEEQQFPIVPCGLCGSQPNAQRQQMKRLVADMSRENPHVVGNLFRAVSNVLPSHLLDRDLWERLGLTEASELEPADLIEPEHLAAAKR
jgi:tRNA 2-thiocytidine biosynthesis protein TtcA